MKRPKWSNRALNDLLEFGQFIAEDDPEAAPAWVEKLRARILAAASLPRAGRRVPELARDDVREVLLKSYRIVYRVLPKGIIILTVFEGHRRLPADV